MLFDGYFERSGEPRQSWPSQMRTPWLLGAAFAWRLSIVRCTDRAVLAVRPTAASSHPRDVGGIGALAPFARCPPVFGRCAFPADSPSSLLDEPVRKRTGIVGYIGEGGGLKVRSFGFGGETRLSTVRLAIAVVIAVTIGLAFLQTRGSRHFSASALIAEVPVLPSERYRCFRKGSVRHTRNAQVVGIKRPVYRNSSMLMSLNCVSFGSEDDSSPRASLRTRRRSYSHGDQRQLRAGPRPTKHGGGADGFDVQRHAVELRDLGFTVIPDAGVDAALVEACRAICSADLARLRDAVEELGLDAVEDNYAFAEIDKRHRLRWSFRPSSGDLKRLIDAAVPAASAVVESLHALPSNPNDDSRFPSFADWTQRFLPSRPTVSYEGAILSSPGAKAQRFHADAGDLHLRISTLSSRHRLFNLFIPLVDLNAGGEGTMMWPGSHLWRTRAEAYYDALDRSGSLVDDERAMAEMVVPGCPAGGFILFDSRVLHRGMPNESGRDRAVAHAFLSTGFAADRKDSPESLEAALARLSDDPEERRRQTEAFPRQQREKWLKLRASSSQ